MQGGPCTSSGHQTSGVKGSGTRGVGFTSSGQLLPVTLVQRALTILALAGSPAAVGDGSLDALLGSRGLVAFHFIPLSQLAQGRQGQTQVWAIRDDNYALVPGEYPHN